MALSSIFDISRCLRVQSSSASSRDLLWIVTSFHALWRILCFLYSPDPPVFSPRLRAATTHFSQTCSPDAHGAALPGGVTDNPKTNGGTSINTWSQDGKEVLPGLYITVANNRSIHSDPQEAILQRQQSHKISKSMIPIATHAIWGPLYRSKFIFYAASTYFEVDGTSKIHCRCIKCPCRQETFAK